MHDYRRLRVWHAANALTVKIYETTKAFPRDERFGLTSQLRRAAVSIQSNIAEGCGRGTRADTARMIQMAIGSTAEAMNQLHLSRDLGYMEQLTFERLDAHAVHIKNMLVKLLRTLRAHSPHASP
ncbi:MAG TPA: four helix bundle protein [Gemmatimonadaceae bacterium]